MTTSKSISTGQRFNAAKHITKKAIYCVDNVDPSLAVTDLCQFVNSLGVKVLSCFSVKPRRRRNEVEPNIVDRKAFRLSIDATDQEKLLDETRWPDSVVIVRPSSLGGAAYCVALCPSVCLSVCLSVRPSRACLH